MSLSRPASSTLARDGIRCRSTRSHKPTPRRANAGKRVGSPKIKIFGPEPDIRLAVNLRWADDRRMAHLFSALLKKNGVRTADGHRAYVLAFARIRFRGTHAGMGSADFNRRMTSRSCGGIIRTRPNTQVARFNEGKLGR